MHTTKTHTHTSVDHDDVDDDDCGGGDDNVDAATTNRAAYVKAIFVLRCVILCAMTTKNRIVCALLPYAALVLHYCDVYIHEANARRLRGSYLFCNSVW